MYRCVIYCIQTVRDTQCTKGEIDLKRKSDIKIVVGIIIFIILSGILPTIYMRGMQSDIVSLHEILESKELELSEMELKIVEWELKYNQLDSEYNDKVGEHEKKEKELLLEIEELKERSITRTSSINTNEPSRGGDRPKTKSLGTFTATTYDLTVASCGKKQSHPQYGITRSGYSLVGQTRESAMTIATDPSVIPLGTRVRVTFKDKDWEHWNGIYTARDTGSAIKGRIIDIFYKDTGDSKTDQVVWDFGRREVELEIIN